MTPREVLRQAEKAWREGAPEFSTFDAFWETVPLGPLGRQVWKQAFLLLDQSNGDFDRAIASALAAETSCVKCGGPLKHAVAIGMYCPAPDCEAIDDQRPADEAAPAVVEAGYLDNLDTRILKLMKIMGTVRAVDVANRIGYAPTLSDHPSAKRIRDKRNYNIIYGRLQRLCGLGKLSKSEKARYTVV